MYLANDYPRGNKIENTKKKAKLSSAELRKKKKERMARYVLTAYRSTDYY
jgi:hypothetical protein